MSATRAVLRQQAKTDRERRRQLANVTQAAENLAAAQMMFDVRIREARSPDLLGGRPSLRDVAAAAGCSPEKVRQIASFGEVVNHGNA